MDIVRKSFICGAAFVAALFIAGVLLPKEEPGKTDVMLRVGAGDDISGLFLKKTQNESEGGFILSDDFMEGYEFKDC